LALLGAVAMAVGIGVAPGRAAAWDHPGVIGFRGTFGIVGQPPENSAEAIRFAYEHLGLDGVELDIQFTRDGMLVAMHDTSLDRTVRVQGLICEYSFAELQAFELGRWEGQPVRIPSFETLLRAEGGRGVFFVDVKDDAGLMIPELQRAVAAAGYDARRLHFTPVLIEGATAYKRAFPESRVSLKTYLLPSEISATYVGGVVAAGLDGIMFPVYTEGPPTGLVVWAHASGILLTGFVYHDDTVEGLQELFDLGMDYVLTNQGQLKAQLVWPNPGPAALEIARADAIGTTSVVRLAWRACPQGPVRVQRSMDLVHWGPFQPDLEYRLGGARCTMEADDTNGFYRLLPVARTR
jgi:glycerophosphoryl diester phosphodiesterase